MTVFVTMELVFVLTGMKVEIVALKKELSIMVITQVTTYFNTDGDAIDSFTDTIPVVANGSVVSGLVADGIPLVLTVSGTGVFAIPSTETTDPSGTSLTVSGDGSFDSNLLTINATMEFVQDTLTYTFTGSK